MLKCIFRKKDEAENISEIEQRIVDRVNRKSEKVATIAAIILCIFEFTPTILITLICLLVREPLNETLQIVLMLLFAGHTTFLVLINKVFLEEIEMFLCAIACKLYFSWYTRKGDALSDEDFETLKEDKKLYQTIKWRKCRGYCVNVCFDILKLLKKGKLKFITIKNFGEDITNEHVLHVLYENNGWVFDTYSHQQFLLEDALEFYESMVYRDFGYEELENLTFEEFMEMQEEATQKWCAENDVEYFLIEDKAESILVSNSDEYL